MSCGTIKNLCASHVVNNDNSLAIDSIPKQGINGNAKNPVQAKAAQQVRIGALYLTHLQIIWILCFP